jgi:hypothetical protein
MIFVGIPQDPPLGILTGLSVNPCSGWFVGAAACPGPSHQHRGAIRRAGAIPDRHQINIALT